MAYIDNILISLNLPITNLSLDQGLQALNSLTNNGIDVVDKNILRDLVNRVSADASGSVTVLYSGEVNTDVGLRPLSIINAMRNNGDDIRVIMDSPAAHFLSHDLFEQALANSLGVQSRDLINKSTEANKFLEGPDGLWGDVSANFIDATEGKVLTITGGAEDSRIFSQRELERIQINEKITSVDGLDRTYLSNMTQEQAYKVIKVASDTSLANLHIVVDGNGNPALQGRQIMIDSRDFFASVDVEGHISNNTAKYLATNNDATMARVIEFVPAERWTNHTEGLNTLSSLEQFGRFAGKLSVGSTALGLLVLSSQIQAAETSLQKQQIIEDWVAHTTAEWIAGSIGSALVVGGVAALTAVSAPVTLGLAIVGGIVGSIVGGDTVYGYIKNGVNALLNDIKTWLFGEKAVSSNGLSNYEESAHLFDLAQKTYRSDPLTLDLDHDGLETRAPSISSPIMFDHTGTGIKTSTGWVLPDDGFLVLDRNNNGTIDNGTELFGDSTPLMNGSFAKNGFEALADQDTNQDGKVDAQDTNWLALKVWRDLNQDGISQANELFSMSALDIDGIHVTSSGHSQILENGNEIAELGTYYKTNGSQEVFGGVSHMADVNLVNDTFHRAFTDNIAISPEVALLPNMIGAGKLRDLHEAMMQSEQLKTLVQQFSIETDYLAQRSLVQDIIKAWVETDTSYQSIEQRAATEDATIFWSNIDNYRYFNHIEDNSNPDKPIYDQLWQNLQIEWNYKLRILEEFNGRYYFKLPSEMANGLTAVDGIDGWSHLVEGQEYKQYTLTIASNHAELLEAAYNNIIINIQNSLLLQTHFKQLIDLIQIVYDETKGIVVDSTRLDQYFEQKIAENFTAGITELYDFGYSTYSLLNNGNLSHWVLLNDAIRQYADSSQAISVIESLGIYTSSSQYYADLGKSNITLTMLGAESDTIYLENKNNILFSGDGDDVIYGGTGNDILSGEKGDDELNGSYGINTYIFNKGDDADVIRSVYDYGEEPKPAIETHIILDVLSEDISVDVSSNYIILKIKGTNDQLYIEDALSANVGLKTITFVDQTVWTITDILAQPLWGSENDDYLIGIDARDNKIYGLSGDDIISSGIGHDYLDGGDGNDWIIAGNGNDLLEGGSGEDRLIGGNGDDTLIGGQGSDVLDGGYGINTYIFNKGDDADVIKNIYFYENELQTIIETHIILDVLPEDVSVDVSADYIFLRIKDTTDQLKIEDALSANVGLKTITFVDQTVWTITDILAQPLLGTEGDDYLVGIDARDNKIYGFEGNDNLYGAIGNDYLDGGTGDDYLDGSYGVNTYAFNRGYGYDSINTPYLDENSPQIETHILMDVLPSDISIAVSYQDVFLAIKDTNDTLEIRGVFAEFSAFKTITFADQTVWTIQDLQNFVSIDGNQDESLTDLLNDSSDMISYHDEYDYLFDELPDNQSLVGQLEGNNTQVPAEALVLEESSDFDYQFNLLTIEDTQKSDIDVAKLLISTNANSESENTQNVKNSLTQKYQLDEVDDQIVFDNTSFSIVNNISLWNTSFNQQFIA
ncbi:bifunctional hemolysin-adenylate cyclase precursor [Acinetobacter calcoaceticus]|uniref:calcium-binding protein n=1 Tax=Acinetobacter calcoaceticus TaxID=471 RepID=UPI000582C368|nr:calcium-binding protein [Acinetobacter calcoaceticus]GAM31525.1 bifunctional hemolysin-adenylate cyclase precursor [Acinetobacter calcoaceticus]